MPRKDLLCNALSLYLAVLAAALPSLALCRVRHGFFFKSRSTTALAASPRSSTDQVVTTAYLSDGSYGVTLDRAELFIRRGAGWRSRREGRFDLEVNASQSTQHLRQPLRPRLPRIQPDGSRYMLAVSNLRPRSYHRAQSTSEADGHHVEVLSQGPLPEDGFVGNDQLRADCQGDKLTLYVNGTGDGRSAGQS